MGAPPQISSTTFASLSLSQVNLRRAARRRLVARGAGAGAGTDPDRGQSGGTGLLIRYSRASGPPTHSKLHTKLKFKLAAHLT